MHYKFHLFIYFLMNTTTTIIIITFIRIDPGIDLHKYANLKTPPFIPTIVIT